jgi:hypothetical protein
MTKYSLLLLSILISVTSCQNAKPIPKDKEPFIGRWISNSGFQLEINSSGTASVTQISDTLDPDYNKLNIKVALPFIANMHVEFFGDSVLQIVKPLYYGKQYRIDKNPYLENDTSKLVLNGIIFFKIK